MRAIKNKKFISIGLMVIVAGLVFLISASPVFAGGCGKTQNKFSFLEFLNPIASLIEKVVKDFGYEVALAAPVSCSSNDCIATCDTFCAGDGTAGVTISWEAAPQQVPDSISFFYYILTVGGVQYKVRPDASWRSPRRCCNPNENSYTITSGLANSTTYDWSVEAWYNCCSGCAGGGVACFPSGLSNRPFGSFTTPDCGPACGDGSCNGSETCFTCPDDCGICPPSNLTATAISCSQVNLSWHDNSSNEDGFKIERCSGSGCTNFIQIDTVGPDITAYPNYGLSEKTTYRYRVRAYSSSSGDSDPSNIASVTTPLCPSVDLKANGSDGPITIDYNKSATLSWSSENTTACTASNSGSLPGWSGAKPLSGVEETGNLIAKTTIFELTCSGPGGWDFDSVTINIKLRPWWKEIIPW